MKQLCLFMIVVWVLSGCAGPSSRLKSSSTGMRKDVFEEMSHEWIVPQGFTVFRITATLKTHNPGVYSSADIHGTTDYRLLVNIDDQALSIEGDLRREKTEPTMLMTPEAGDGIRYRFSKNLLLKPGIHRIVVALPDDDIALEKELCLTEGKLHHLSVEPIYRSRPGKRGPWAYTTAGFTEGICSIGLALDGNEL